MEPIIIVIAVILVVGVLVWGVINLRTNRDDLEERLKTIDENVESVVDMEQVEQLKAENKAKEKEETELRDRFDKLIEQRSFGKKWRTQLSRADLKLTVAEFAAVHILAMVGFFVVSYFVLFGQQLVMGIVGAFVGFFAPRIYLSMMVGRRLKAFENQLPDTLGLWVNALRSGYSVPQAMEAIGRDSPSPTSTEFRRVVQEMQLGIDMEDALAHMLNRMESEDLDLVVTAVNIQREVGGNLAEILDVISHTIRERIKLKGEISVLTAQGRITGYLISFLPIVLALFLYAINPTYMANLFENRTCGWPLLGIGLTMIGIGAAVINKIVDIDI
jgi:tight adherence protein B